MQGSVSVQVLHFQTYCLGAEIPPKSRGFGIYPRQSIGELLISHSTKLEIVR